VKADLLVTVNLVAEGVSVNPLEQKDVDIR